MILLLCSLFLTFLTLSTNAVPENEGEDAYDCETLNDANGRFFICQDRNKNAPWKCGISCADGYLEMKSTKKIVRTVECVHGKKWDWKETTLKCQPLPSKVLSCNRKKLKGTTYTCSIVSGLSEIQPELRNLFCRTVCMEGYELVGGNFPRLCTVHNKWSKPLATCKVQEKPFVIPCKFERFKTIKNGEIVCHKTQNSVICSNSCLYSKVLVGRETNECFKNGKWRFPFPECAEKKECLSPEVNSDDVHTNTTCTTKGCFTRCKPGYSLYGKYIQDCNWLKKRHKGYAYWPKCIPSFLNTRCTEEQHKICVKKSSTICHKKSDVAICVKTSATSDPICDCTEINVEGNCNKYRKLICAGTERNCYQGDNEYTETKRCDNLSVNRFNCSCKIKKKLPCPELDRDDPDRHCWINDRVQGIQCNFKCGPGERKDDPWDKNGYRVCSPNGKWDYPLYIQCLKE